MVLGVGCGLRGKVFMGKEGCLCVCVCVCVCVCLCVCVDRYTTSLAPVSSVHPFGEGNM